MQKRKRNLRILYGLLALTLLFIWGNSLLPVEQSKAESVAVGGFLTPFLELFVGKGNVTDHLVRKLAHFCEFGALGMILGAILRTRQQKDPLHFSYVIFTGVSAAVADEAIQLLSEGRGAQVQDVLLDSAGAVTGLVAVCLLFALFGRGKQKNDQEDKP